MSVISTKKISKELFREYKKNPKDIGLIVEKLVNFLHKHQLLSLAHQIIKNLEYYKSVDDRHNSLIILAKSSPDDATINKVKKILKTENSSPVECIENDQISAGLKAEYRGVIVDLTSDNLINRLNQSLAK